MDPAPGKLHVNPLMDILIVPHRVYEVGTLAVDRWAVTFSTARREQGGTAARPGPSWLYQM